MTEIISLMRRNVAVFAMFALPVVGRSVKAQSSAPPDLFQVPEVRSSWDDLTEGVETTEDWQRRRKVLKQRFLDLSGLNDGVPGTQRQRVLMLMRVMDIYELEKSPQNFAFYVHGRGHSVAHESRQLMYAWMDTHLKPPEATRTWNITTSR